MGTFLRVFQLPALIALLTFIEVVVPLRIQPRVGNGRLATNLTLMATTLATLLSLNILLISITVFVRAQHLGLLPVVGISGAAAVLVGVIALDFATYVSHVLLHKTAWGWRVHKVHHSDAAVDATTTLRQHPIEHAIRFAFSAATVCVLGLPLTAVAIAQALSGANAVFEHSNIRAPKWLDRGLVWFWVTPDMHKLHHSRVQAETDSNYANLLSLFDRAFGTYTPSSRVDVVRYGLDGYDTAEQQSIAGVLTMPFCTGSAEPAGAEGSQRVA